ncbi:MAG: COG4315 family predicted lipoprotein [Candidatus Saccharimonadales bacterium]
MKKKLQRGVAPLETLLILIIIAIVAFVVWYVFHTKNTTNNTYSNSGNTQINPPASSTSNTPSKIVQTKSDPKVGQYLADSNGKTLYTYGADTTGVSNCTGSCLTDWPIYKATATTNLPNNVTVITRSDGTKQYAYKGMSLYYFTGDTAAGQITGNGVSDFSIAKP